MSEHIIVLADRVKELSRTTGSGNIVLDGAATGFGSFANSYTYNDALFYAVTDGINYEVGSGQYILDGADDALTRFPFNSSNGNAAVNFPAGVKEVYVTYPGKYAVMSASGLSGFDEPDASGLAFWGSNQLLNYDSNIIWDKTNSRLGINNATPTYTIDIGGEGTDSSIRVSGLIVGTSGVTFSNGVQLTAYTENALDATTGTDAVFALSGVSNEIIQFQEQNAGLFFAGPPSGCNPSGACAPDMPTFRVITDDDLPSLASTYLTQDPSAYIATGMSSGIAFWSQSGVVDHDPYLVWDKTQNFLGVNKLVPTKELDVDGDAIVSGAMTVGGDLAVFGSLDVQGDLTYIDSTTVTIADHQIELGSMSGVAVSGDAYINDGGIVIKSQDSDKKWTWIDATDAWTSSQSVDVPSVIFDDSSVISGAYHSGSGISISNGIEINIADVFAVAGNDAVTTNMMQADGLYVSGVSGVSVSLTASGVFKTLIIDPSVLIGNLDASGTDNSAGILANSASGVVISGIADANTTSSALNVTNVLANTVSGVAISGWADYTIDASGQVLDTLIDAVSGWAQDYADNISISGGLGWTISDQISNTDLITNNVVTVSGTSGVNTFYDAANDNMIVSGGTLETSIAVNAAAIIAETASGVAISGWSTANFSTQDGRLTVNAANILANTASGVTISGWAATTNVNADAVLDTKINEVSGWAGSGGSTVSAGSGLINLGGTIHTSGTANFEQITFGASVSETIRIGTDAGDSTTASHGTFVGNIAGYNMNGTNTNATAVGYNAFNDTDGDMSSSSAFGNSAGYASAESSDALFLGPSAGQSASGWNNGIMIGNAAAKSSVLCNYGIAMGYQAAFQGSGNDYVTSIGYQAGYNRIDSDRSVDIGWRAGYGSDDGWTVNLGNEAGVFCVASSNTNNIGTAAGRWTVDCINYQHFGNSAAYQASGNAHGSFIGYQAGYQSSLLETVDGIGRETLRGASYMNYGTFMGKYAGQGASGCDYASAIGFGAGSQMSTSTGVIAFGDFAGSGSAGMNDSIVLGKQSANSTVGVTDTIIIGELAGNASQATNNCVLIGKNAGYNDVSGVRNITIGYQAGYQADRQENAINIGYLAGSYTTAPASAINIGKQAGASSLSSYSINIGELAGYGSVGNSDGNVFIGYEAGKHITGGSSLIIRAGLTSQVSNNWGSTAQSGIIDIGNVITGLDTGYIRIGDTGTVSALGQAALSVKPVNNNDIGLKLWRSTSTPSEPLAVAELSGGADNLFINKNGYLAIPTYATVAAATGAVSPTANEGVMLLGGSGLLVTDGTSWYEIALSLVV